MKKIIEKFIKRQKKVLVLMGKVVPMSRTY